MNKRKLLLIFLILNQVIYTQSAQTLYPNLPFNKVVIWGHKLHSHTHSYIHYAFHKAFKSLGFETHWLDNNSNVNNFDFSQTLFITEGQADRKIPVRDDCLYILHNCTNSKYKPLFEQKRAITLQVYTHDVLSRNLTKIDECIYCSAEQQLIHMPWATDLLPHEIENIKKIKVKKENSIYFIGTVGSGLFGNRNQINPFRQACIKDNKQLIYRGTVGIEESIELIQRSYMAPALQGEWQVEKGYIPCRIFKNISYGQMGITNSEAVYNLFDKKIVYNPDTYQLFYDAKKRLESITQDELFELMDIVKNKHTYIQRIQTILNFFNAVYNMDS